MNRHRIGTAAAVVAGLFFLTAGWAHPVAQVRPAAPASPGARAEVTAHEWGTFTSVADEQGASTEWLPLAGPGDLPCFVDYYQNRLFKFIGPDYGAVLDYQQARTRIRGTVRMETPVIYFYADKDTSVDVSVKFPDGLFTEWYPRAEVTQMPAYEKVLRIKNLNSAMTWKGVVIRPSAAETYPTDGSSSHYYAARRTDAAPVQVGIQLEKFLFYRGVAGFNVPLTATVAEEETVIVKNTGSAPLPGVVLFRRQGNDVSYRIFGTLDKEIALTTSPSATSIDALRQYLHQTLVENGLYPKEAAAMLETWGDTWFEEGTRVFYVMPRQMVDAVLPLTITPTPAAISRTFVGRIEVITPGMEAEVAKALASKNVSVLDRYGRLLGPIGDRLMVKTASPEAKQQMLTVLSERLRAFAGRVGGC